MKFTTPEKKVGEIRVKAFKEDSIFDLERKMNDFFNEASGEVTDIAYEIFTKDDKCCIVEYIVDVDED